MTDLAPLGASDDWRQTRTIEYLPYLGAACAPCAVLGRLSYVNASDGWCAYCGLPTPDPTALYRFFDGDDVLLYVGVSRWPLCRMTQHAREKSWWRSVVRSTIEWLPDRATAMATERMAIGLERPRHNVTHAR